MSMDSTIFFSLSQLEVMKEFMKTYSIYENTSYFKKGLTTIREDIKFLERMWPTNKCLVVRS